MSVSLKWPAPGRLIPVASNSVRVNVSAPDGTFIDGRLLSRPPAGGVTTATFNGLPLGAVNVTATAFPETYGAGVAQATTTQTVTIQSGLNAPLPLTMESTVDSLVVMPAEWQVGVGEQRTFTVTGKNAAGEIVLLAPTRLQWSTNFSDIPLPPVETVVTVDSGGLARAVGAGEAKIHVIETESGKQADVPVVVNQPINAAYRIVSLPNNDIAYNTVNGKLYALLPATAGDRGNSIVSLEQTTGAISAPVFVGSNPGTMAISDDGKFVYIGLSGAQKIVRFNIETNAVDQEFVPRVPSTNGGDSVLTTSRIIAQPGRPDVIVVAGQIGFNSTVAVFENGVPRSKILSYFQIPTLVWGGSAERVYGFNNNYPDGFSRMVVDNDGITVVDTFTNGSLLNNNEDIVYVAGKIFGSSGRVIDPEKYELLGTCPFNGPVAPAVDLNRAFYAQSDYNGVTINACNITSFLSAGDLTITGLTQNYDSYNKKLVRWGPKGLAYRTSREIVLIPNAPGL